jgi:hypothetical protein
MGKILELSLLAVVSRDGATVGILALKIRVMSKCGVVWFSKIYELEFIAKSNEVSGLIY